MRETSRAVWERISPHLPPKRAAALLCVLDHADKFGGAMTANEIGSLGTGMGRCHWKRVGELAAANILIEHSERVCTVTGERVLTYAPNYEAMHITTRKATTAPKRPTAEQMLETVDALRTHVLVLKQHQRPMPPGVVATARWLKHQAQTR